MSQHDNELRCFCSRHPLIATFGTEEGELFIHVRVYKQRRIFGEVKVFGPFAKIVLRCRECLRWQRVVIRQPNRPELQVIPDDEAPAGND